MCCLYTVKYIKVVEELTENIVADTGWLALIDFISRHPDYNNFKLVDATCLVDDVIVAS